MSGAMLGAVGGPLGGDRSASAGATFGLTEAMTSIALSVALPIAVPNPVLRSSTARTRIVLSSVGLTAISVAPLKVTIPICAESGWVSMNPMAACWATARRFGSMSVAHMDREMSSARMIEVRLTSTSVTR